MPDGCFLRGQLVPVHRVILDSGWSIAYTCNLGVILLRSKAKQKWKTTELHFLCEQLFLSDWGLALEHEEKRDEASHLWWWVVWGASFVLICFRCCYKMGY